MVQAFGVSYPKADVEHIPAGAFVTDLVYAVTAARDQGDVSTLTALRDLLDIYKTRMGALLPARSLPWAPSRLKRVPEQVSF